MYELFVTFITDEGQKGNTQSQTSKSEASVSTADSKPAKPNHERPGVRVEDHGHTLAHNQQQVIHSSDDKSRKQLLSTSSSLGEEDFSSSQTDVAEDLDTGSNGGRVASNGTSGTQGNSSSSTQNKRYRTNLTNMQIHVMKYIFPDYKTPTMAECEALGSFIGLQKRVVQVWFQNARAKEKKGKLMNNNVEEPLVTECLRCGVVYSPKYTLQEHIFSARHINQLRSAFNGKLTECDKEAMRKQAEVRQCFDCLLLSYWLLAACTAFLPHALFACFTRL